MKILIEGIFSRMQADIEESERTGEPLDPETQKYLDSLRVNVMPEVVPPTPASGIPTSKSISLKDKFRNYVNRSRSPWSITANDTFTGTYKQLQTFAKSFEKTNPGVKVFITSEYRQGEYIPILKDVSYSGGEQK